MKLKNWGKKDGLPLYFSDSYETSFQQPTYHKAVVSLSSHLLLVKYLLATNISFNTSTEIHEKSCFSHLNAKIMFSVPNDIILSRSVFPGFSELLFQVYEDATNK